VNAYFDPDAIEDLFSESVELSRATEEEKESQLRRLTEFKSRHEASASGALERLQKVAIAGDNIFAELMNTVRVCSLGQITKALFDVGGQYRRNM
jgi:methylmalonyl-CoA mutase